MNSKPPCSVFDSPAEPAEILSEMNNRPSLPNGDGSLLVDNVINAMKEFFIFISLCGIFYDKHFEADIDSQTCPMFIYSALTVAVLQATQVYRKSKKGDIK
ncbi:hypothetical protein N7520_008162 [Penicillium odoratum]|uniref:uncharacterized protein n=1 Tax=Penicillium odoratum TaxID=1167516 RepID=UPI002548FB00|nr:uncharacterized protein N7520_008162 [Penicillium odoratum]KAJ5761006.1 hypothetical protein N7520_008162 [Penicillium odoratum]